MIKYLSKIVNTPESREFVNFFSFAVANIIERHSENPNEKANDLKKLLSFLKLTNQTDIPEVKDCIEYIDSLRDVHSGNETKMDNETKKNDIREAFKNSIKDELKKYTPDQLISNYISMDMRRVFGKNLAEYISIALSGLVATATVSKPKTVDGVTKTVGSTEYFFGRDAEQIKANFELANKMDMPFEPFNDKGPHPRLSIAITQMSKKYDLYVERSERNVHFKWFLKLFANEKKLKKFYAKLQIMSEISPSTKTQKRYKKLSRVLRKIGFNNDKKLKIDNSIVFLYDRAINDFIRLDTSHKIIPLPNGSETEFDYEILEAGQTRRGFVLNALNLNNVSYCTVNCNFFLNNTSNELLESTESRKIFLEAVQINEMFRKNLFDFFAEEIDRRKKEQEEEKQNKALESLLGKDAYNKMKNEGFKIGGTEDRHITIQFADLVGFTTMSEKLRNTPYTGVIMNQFLSRMNSVFDKYKVYLDKSIGDATMVLAGTPMDRIKELDLTDLYPNNKILAEKKDQITDIELQAIVMTKVMQEMNEQIKELNIEFEPIFNEYSVAPLQIRAGYYDGIVTLGYFGSKERMAYTAMGRPVNTAARYEAASRPSHLAVSEDTFVILQKYGIAQEMFQNIVNNEQYDAYRNATMDEIFASTTRRLKGIEDDHKIRVILLDSNYPKLVLDQVQNYLKDNENGPENIGDLIFGLHKSGEIENVAENWDKMDFHMIEWLMRKLSKKYYFEFDFSKGDELFDHIPELGQFHIKPDMHTAKEPMMRLKHISIQREMIGARQNINVYYDTKTGQRKPISEFKEALHFDLQRDLLMRYLLFYVREIKELFVRQLRMFQRLHSVLPDIKKNLGHNVNGDFEKHENMRSLVIKTVASLNGLVINKTPEEVAEIVMKKIGALSIENQKKAYVQYFVRIVSKALLNGKLSEKGLEKIKKAVLIHS